MKQAPGWAILESVLNAGYIIKITKELSVQPDIQYIIRPGGFG